ncbi:MAG: hypothetical protein KJS90_01450 [Acidobacteria bacterium]|nr:hypothetical protein [Acidobacteriota bacterium]
MNAFRDRFATVPARIFAPVVVLLVASLLAACSSLPLSRSYLGNTTYGTSVIAPGDWKSFDADAVLADAPDAEQAFIEAFGPEGVDPTRPMFGDVPGGLLVVNLYPGIDAGRLAARNALFTDLDAAIASGAVSVLAESSGIVDGLWERRTLTLEVRLDETGSRDTAQVPGTVVRVLQETMLGTRSSGKDAAGVELFPLKTLILGCTAECFAANESVLRDVKDSWRVE